MTIYFTSDLHLQHNKEFIYSPRGFTDILTHDLAIINNINSVVKEDDILYILGDLVLNDLNFGIFLLNKIKCKNIKVIKGNHDSNKKLKRYESEVPNITFIEKTFILPNFNDCLEAHPKYILTHKPILNIDLAKEGAFYICGHTHTKDRFLDINSRCYHVELDAHNNMPISLDKIIEEIRNYEKFRSC